jgi:hypothetical protein
MRLTLCWLTKVGSGLNIRVSARPAYKRVSRPVFRYVGIVRILKEECRRIYRYAGLTKLLYCARTVEAGLPDLGSLVRHIGPGYGQRLYPGYISQPRCHIPTIKEGNIQAWKQTMIIGCTVKVYQPSLCQVQSLTSQW